MSFIPISFNRLHVRTNQNLFLIKKHTNFIPLSLNQTPFPQQFSPLCSVCLPFLVICKKESLNL